MRGHFFRSVSGNIAVASSLLILPIIAMAGITIDYAYLYRLESSMQAAADSAALATAKELVLADVEKSTLDSIARNYVLTGSSSEINASNTKIDSELADDKFGVTVSVSHAWEPFFLHYIDKSTLPIEVTATAKLAGRGTICLLALDETRENAIFLRKKAHLEALGCGVYSNSQNERSIQVANKAILRAGVICSSGGFRGVKKASFEPEPLSDCPRVGDPLADRPKPVKGSCDHKHFAINTGTHVLYPGTYCRGLKITGDAEVWLKPGIYVITGGKLQVTDNAIMQGEEVGFYLNGHKAKLRFTKQTTVNLTAPTTGLLAGILVFEDRDASSKLQKHLITSDNARTLLGTIYLPNGTIRIDSEAPIADKAAYTAIIARTIELDKGPTLHLNSDYEATNVPVPEGLVRDRVYLSK